MNSENQTLRVPRWVLFICGLPVLCIMVITLAIEASALDTLQGSTDPSSLFKLRFNMANIRSSTVFTPALERAGYNLSNNSSDQMMRTGLEYRYELQGNSFTVCSYGYDNCLGSPPKVMEHSVLLDFPRQFLFNAVSEIRGVTSVWNGSSYSSIKGPVVKLEFPEDVVPLVPEGYMDEMFEEKKVHQRNTWIFGLVVSAVGLLVVLINSGVCIIMGSAVKMCAIINGIVLIIQYVKDILMQWWLEGHGMSLSRAEEYFSGNYSTWGVSFGRASPLYFNESSTFGVTGPLSVLGFGLAFVMHSASLQIAQDVSNRRLEEEKKWALEEHADRLV